MYKSVDPKVDFPRMEEAVLRFWNENKIFERSVTNRRGQPEFVFYDGPPFATGLPHFGHFVPGTIKDIIPRYQTMKGKYVERRFGWDCHGLPVENLIEKELGLNSKTDIERYGEAEFNEACRASVLRYVKEWRTIMGRAGRWVDFDNDYKTMDPDYMETIWWVMKSLWEKELLYEGYYILPYCPRCSTVLSNHELNLGGYKDVHDPAITIKFQLKNDPKAFFLAWTTTPWTLPSNLALSLGPDITYVRVRDGEDDYILAESRLSAYYQEVEKLEIVWRKKGRELGGIFYEPLFPYFKDSPNAFQTFVGDHVTDSDGTGIVHTAPGFGEDDYRILQGTGITTVVPIDAEGRFTAEVGDYQGIFVKDADKPIIERLKAEGKLVKREQILHAYPHCWRCSSHLIYRAISSWFVKVTAIKDKMLAANGAINWVPSHIQGGRFGKWLENARDWAVSRNRYWGNPLPIWRCDDCGKTLCLGSLDELEALSGQRPADLHKHFVDTISWACTCGKGTMHRIPEVLDCWFESGAMPYGQVHYPFENKAKFESHFPADFINEGLDQTRGWFYTLTILAAGLFDKPAFQNCVVSGLVLASDGKKMSKSLRNYTDPAEVMDKFGADALRLFLMLSGVTKAEDLRYSDDGVRDVLREILLPLWNAYSFFVTYANLDKVTPKGVIPSPSNPLDGWILSELEKLTETVTSELDRYEVTRAVENLVSFLDLLNNWYIRRSRRRFWKSGSDSAEAYETLYRVLKRFVTLLAPVIPFTAEEIWQNLKTPQDPDSVHLADWPHSEPERRRPELEVKMEVSRRTVSMGRALRNTHNLKTRQPLKAVYLVTRDPAEKAVLREMEDLIREELNVKEVVFQDNEESLVEYSAKANFKVLGKVLGPAMKAASERIEALAPDEILTLLDGASLHLDVEGRSVELTQESVLVNRREKANLKVINEGSLTLALDSEISQELKLEGHIRDLIRSVQNARKETGFDVSDRVRLVFGGTPVVQEALVAFGKFLSEETLARSWSWSGEKQPGNAVVAESGDEAYWFVLEKA
ncbi:MAG: isoleucine--tRNA ligase [Spirochaetales bacterium]|nr:isoleucine--tRNA ligase [Spirochaetales bacterium]